MCVYTIAHAFSIQPVYSEILRGSKRTLSVVIIFQVIQKTASMQAGLNNRVKSPYVEDVNVVSVAVPWVVARFCDVYFEMPIPSSSQEDSSGCSRDAPSPLHLQTDISVNRSATPRNSFSRTRGGAVPEHSCSKSILASALHTYVWLPRRSQPRAPRSWPLLALLLLCLSTLCYFCTCCALQLASSLLAYPPHDAAAACGASSQARRNRCFCSHSLFPLPRASALKIGAASTTTTTAACARSAAATRRSLMQRSPFASLGSSLLQPQALLRLLLSTTAAPCSAAAAICPRFAAPTVLKQHQQKQHERTNGVQSCERGYSFFRWPRQQLVASTTAAPESSAVVAAAAGVLHEQHVRGSGAFLYLMKRQLQQQVRQHQPEIKALLQGLLEMVLQCLRNYFGVYLLGLSLLFLPFCSSPNHLEAISRVPLNDPYLLRHLNLPEDASPSNFHLPYYEVIIPPTSSWLQPLPGSSSSATAAANASAAAGSAPTATDLQDAGTAAFTANCDFTAVEEPKELAIDEENTPVCSSISSKNACAPGVLKGWLIPAEDRSSRKAIICTHGWLANRQACLPFLNIAEKTGLRKTHHFLLFDLKSCGGRSSKQDVASVDSSSLENNCKSGFEDQLGCQAALDLLQAIVYLREQFGITTISLYSQGVSAMGAMLLLKDYRSSLERQWGITFDRVVLESPVCSASDALMKQPLATCLAQTAAWMHAALLWIVQRRLGNQLRRLRASRLLRAEKPFKMLVFASKADKLTPWSTLRYEMLQLPESDRPDWIYVFSTGAHCDLARTHPDVYANVLKHFYSTSSFLTSLWEKIAGSRTPPTAPGVQAYTPRGLKFSAADAAAENLGQPYSRHLNLSTAAVALIHPLLQMKPQSQNNELWVTQ